MILLEQAQSWHCSPASEISACALEPALPEFHSSSKHSEQELALEKSGGKQGWSWQAQPSRMGSFQAESCGRWGRWVGNQLDIANVQVCFSSALKEQRTIHSSMASTVPSPPGSEKESRQRFRIHNHIPLELQNFYSDQELRSRT